MLTSFDPSDMQEVNDLFLKIRAQKMELMPFRSKEHCKQADEALAKEFDGYLWTVMESLGQQLARDLS